MNTHRLIIHELEKEANSVEVTYKSSDSLVEINSDINALIYSIHDAFERSLTKYSKFNKANTSNAVYLNSTKYLNDSQDEIFIEFSKASLGELAASIQREPFATGGYYLYVDYEVNQFRYISIIILRNKEAFNIKWNRDKFSVGATENINIDKLAMGFRLNCNFYLNENEERSYLGLVSNQGDNLSKYFLKWVNADNVTNNQSNTKTLINVIKDLGPEDFGLDKDDFERSVFEYVSLYRKRNNNRIDVDQLSNYLYKDPLKIRNHAASAFNKELDPVFRGYASELNRLIRLRASTKGITVSIDTDKFDDEEVKILNGALIITNQKIVQDIQNQRERGNE